MATVYEKMKAIADAIREVTKKQGKLTLNDMASGVNEVYEAGKEAFSKEWWDMRTLNNSGKAYLASACAYWGFDSRGRDYDNIEFANRMLLSIPYPIKGVYMSSMFSMNKATVDITAEMLDTSINDNFYRMFQQCNVPRIEVLDLTNATSTGDIFRDGYTHTIDRLIFNAEGNTVIASDIFGHATRLKNIHSVEGLIANYNLAFPTSPLTAESVKNIILCLKDYSGTANEYSYTVTFKTSAFNALEAEGATAEYNGTACTWAELIGYKKWNLTKA